MATSPFQRFRKHQKTFLALLCVLLMVAFVLADMLGNPGGGGMQDPVVIETNIGNLYRSSLEGLRRSRGVANRFVHALTGRPENFGPADDESLLNLFLMSHKAESLGMVVSDDAINSFLAEFGPLTPDQVRQALDLTQVNEVQLFAALRRELQARWLQNQYFYSVAAWTPAERWRMFKRVHRQIESEVLAVPVSAFMDDIPEPTDRELQQFFAEYQKRMANPDSPEPGFSQPQRANFQYIVADYNAVVEKAREAITEEDIRNFYEANKSLFPNTTFEEAPLVDPRDIPDPPAPRVRTQRNTDSGDEPSQNDSSQPQGSAPEGAALQGDAVGRTFPVALQDNESSDNDASQGTNANQDNAANPTQGGNEAANPAPVENAAENTASEGSSDNDPPASEPALTPPANESGQTASQGTQGQSAPPATPRRSLAEIQRELIDIPTLYGGPPPQYEPLWLVKDEVRDRLAQQRAEQWILDGHPGVTVGLRELHAQVASLTEEWREADLRYADSPEQLKPIREQLKQQALDAVRSGVESSGYRIASPTGMVSLREISEMELGQSERVSSVSGVELSPQAASFAEAFRRATLFEPEISRSTDLDRNFYLFWKIDDRAAYTPETMQEVRDQVVTAWKLVKARKPAMDKALQLEEEARKQNKSLTEMSFAGQKGVALPPLTMMQPSPFAQFGGMSLDWTPLPDEIQQPSQELQLTLFGLDDGEYAVSYNAPQNVVYVMHVTGSSFVRSGQRISPFVAQQNFMASPIQSYAAASRPEQIELAQEWTLELHREYGVNIVGELRFQ